MTAALSLLEFVDAPAAPAPLMLPRELAEMLDESPRSLAVFQRLDEKSRHEYCAYVAEATLPATRERRAALVAMSLAGQPAIASS